jgi:hypothetical protein
VLRCILLYQSQNISPHLLYKGMYNYYPENDIIENAVHLFFFVIATANDVLPCQLQFLVPLLLVQLMSLLESVSFQHHEQ